MTDALEVHPEGKKVAIARSPGEEGVVNFQPLQGANAEPSPPVPRGLHQKPFASEPQKDSPAGKLPTPAQPLESRPAKPPLVTCGNGAFSLPKLGG